jgi:hypothetical protein
MILRTDVQLVAINFNIHELNNNKNNNSVDLIQRLPTPLGYHRQPIKCLINTKKYKDKQQIK